MPLPLLALVGPLIVGGVLGVAFQMLQNPVGVAGNKLFPVLPNSPGILATLRNRGLIDSDLYRREMASQGLGDRQADEFLKAAQFFPTPTDLVNWTSKEVFEPQSIEQFGLAEEFDALDLELFKGAGVDEEQAKNFWIAHWQHPPFNQVAEMLHRDILVNASGPGLVTPGSPEWESLRERGEALLFDWYKLVEIPPFWRDRLTKLQETLPTRVDLRRMYDMRVLDVDGLMRGYLDLGFGKEQAQNQTQFARIVEDFPILMQRYENAWITRAELQEELEKLGLPEERALEFIETRIDNLARQKRVATERDLTKSEIIKGAKKNVITVDEAKNLMMEMGYDEDEATFIININIEAEGSPETPLEFKRLTQQFRKATGQKATIPSSELLDSERAFKSASTALDVAIDGDELPHEISRLTSERQAALAKFRNDLTASGVSNPQGEPA